ncbi:MAG TPA: glycosyltransferase [Acidobacteriota bacterium]|nr:glycosyltransferase [Acidobacteriota bacterium]
MSTTHSPKIILSAYQCGPGMGSVSQIGWEWYSRLRKLTPTTLVTHIRNREALENHGVSSSTGEVVYIDTEWFAGPLYRLAKWLFPRSEHAVFLLSSLDFYVYDRQATRILKKRMRAGESWDVVQSVTPVSPIAATTLHQLGLPIVIGPLNGGLGNPSNFPELMAADSGWFYRVRDLGRLIDWWNGSSRNADIILTATQATRDYILPKWKSKCVPMLENGVELTRFCPTPWPDAPSAIHPLKILFVGRLIPVKGIPMLLRAVAGIRHEFPIEVTVVGDGPMAQDWQHQAQALELSKIVTFTGNLSLDQVAVEMRKAHIFCLPSIRESGGAVLLEAMASQRPIVAVAFGGPAEIVDDQVGAAIEPRGTEFVVSELQRIFRDVVANPAHWQRRGEVGLERARERYGWDAKIQSALRLYHQLLAK